MHRERERVFLTCAPPPIAAAGRMVALVVLKGDLGPGPPTPKLGPNPGGGDDPSLQGDDDPATSVKMKAPRSAVADCGTGTGEGHDDQTVTAPISDTHVPAIMSRGQVGLEVFLVLSMKVMRMLALSLSCLG